MPHGWPAKGGKMCKIQVLMAVVENNERNQNYQFCSKNRSQLVYFCQKFKNFWIDGQEMAKMKPY